MPTSLKIDDEMKGRIQALAQQRDRSAHWIMREAIREYVDREEARESFREEALDAWTAYQETGRHLTGAETTTWLESWGSEQETGAPECHD
jgi:predicted transcriptional regulator